MCLYFKFVTPSSLIVLCIVLYPQTHRNASFSVYVILYVQFVSDHLVLDKQSVCSLWSNLFFLYLFVYLFFILSISLWRLHHVALNSRKSVCFSIHSTGTKAYACTSSLECLILINILMLSLPYIIYKCKIIRKIWHIIPVDKLLFI